MANVPSDLRYSEDHEYVKRSGEGSIVHIGITQVENRSLRILLQLVVRLMPPGDHFPPQTLPNFVVVHEPVTLARRVFARPSASA